MRRSLDIALPGGEVLAASFEEPSVQGPWPGVLLCHGFTGHKAEDGRLFVRLARALAADGIASLRFDFRGSGDSDGEFEDATLESQQDDARAALEALRGRTGIDRARLAVVGLSLGSVVASLLAADEGLAALVLWATIAFPQRLFEGHRLPELRPGWASGPAFLASVERARPLEALARYAGPLLCVHGARDYLPIASPRAALLTSRHPASRLEIVDGEHTFGSDPERRRAVELTRQWLGRQIA